MHYRVLWLLVFMTGCVSLPNQKQVEDVHWAGHRAAVLAVSDWAAEGKAGARQGDQSTSFNLLWRQQADSYDIRLFGPLGQGAVHIQGDASHAVLNDGQHTATAADLATLIAENHHIQLPLNALQFWLRGIPEPYQPATLALGPKGLIAELTQFGWTVQYSDYMATQPPLPRKLTLLRGDTSAKIIVKSWDLEAQP